MLNNITEYSSFQHSDMYLDELVSPRENQAVSIKNLTFEKSSRQHERLFYTDIDLTEEDWVELKRIENNISNKIGYWLLTGDVILALASLWPARINEFEFHSSKMWQILERLIDFESERFLDLDMRASKDTHYLSLHWEKMQACIRSICEHLMCKEFLFNNSPPSLRDKVDRIISPENKYRKLMMRNLSLIINRQLKVAIKNHDMEWYLTILTPAKILFPDTAFPAFPQKMTNKIIEGLKEYRFNSITKFTQYTALLKLHGIEGFTNPTFDEETRESMKESLRLLRREAGLLESQSCQILFLHAFHLSILDAAEVKITKSGIQLSGFRPTVTQLPAQFPFMNKLKLFAETANQTSA